MKRTRHCANYALFLLKNVIKMKKNKSHLTGKIGIPFRHFKTTKWNKGGGGVGSNLSIYVVNQSYLGDLTPPVDIVVK